ncbi:MAG: 50S ribosomal protein L17 [Planctomycetia bacterium]|nr:50S ribosomal protein L17 [Planctomycetia bacterium]
MRHRRKGRILGRSPSHQRALLRNLASALFLTERDAEFDPNAPKVKGRIITTLEKAKEVRPLVEKCITLARRAVEQRAAAAEFGSTAKRNSEEWKAWKQSERYKSWVKAVGPSIAARRRVLKMLGDKKAVKVLFDDVAARFNGRTGGYTRIMRLAKPRLGDSGTRAILEFVGVRDRAAPAAAAPAFEGGEAKK